MHSFEPVKSTYNRLQTICEAAQLKNVVLNNRALAEKSGTVRIYVYDQAHSGWNTRADRPLEDYGIDVQPVDVEEVQSITVDEYCQENGVKHIDLLKIDV